MTAESTSMMALKWREELFVPGAQRAGEEKRERRRRQRTRVGWEGGGGDIMALTYF